MPLQLTKLNKFIYYNIRGFFFGGGGINSTVPRNIKSENK